MSTTMYISANNVSDLCQLDHLTGMRNVCTYIASGGDSSFHWSCSNHQDQEQKSKTGKST